jgi:hypothetical protein
MYKYLFLIWLFALFHFHSQAQVESLPKLRVGVKITPLQFLFGEKAATVEFKFASRYSAEVKAGIFGQNRFRESSIWSEEKVVASGYLTQIGFKRYFYGKKEDQSKYTWQHQPVAYLQVLGLYKQSSFDQRRLLTGPSSFDYQSVEAQSINTYGLKVQAGYEFPLWKIAYLETYIGLGGRIRDIKRTIYDEYPPQLKSSSFYPIEAKKRQAYFTPQLGFNLGFELPFKKG